MSHEADHMLDLASTFLGALRLIRSVIEEGAGTPKDRLREIHRIADSAISTSKAGQEVQQ